MGNGASLAAVDQGRLLENDLLLFTLRANSYLANTRTAAYLWIREHPEKAEILLDDEQYCSEYLSPLLRREFETIESLTKYLSNQVIAVHKAGQVTQELVIAPKAGGCKMQAAALAKQLSGYVCALLAEKME